MTHRLSFDTGDNEFIIDTGTNDERGLPIVSFDGDTEVSYSALSDPVQWEITEHRDFGCSDNCAICRAIYQNAVDRWADARREYKFGNSL